jgi:MFS family permease
VNVGFAMLQMLGDLHMSETAYGLGAGIFFIGYVLCGVPSNLMLYKVGARRWLTLLMVVWGILSTSLMFIRDANEFYLIRLLTGASEAGFFPGLVIGFFPCRASSKLLLQPSNSYCACQPQVTIRAVVRAYRDQISARLRR